MRLPLSTIPTILKLLEVIVGTEQKQEQDMSRSKTEIETHKV